MGTGLADDNTGDRGARVVGLRGVWRRLPFRFPTGAAEQPRGYGPMDLQTSAAAEVQASASSQGVLDLTSALANEGMMPGTTFNSDAERSHEGIRRAWRDALARTSAEAGEPVCYHTLSF